MAFGKIPAYRKYELFMERYRSAADEFIIPHVNSFSKENPARLLDIGSGDGYLKYFCDQENIDFHGVEIQPRRIKICEEMGYKINTFNIETDRFPYDDNSYDIIVASHVIEHLYNPEAAIKEIHRVLKPNGIVVIGVPMHVNWISKLLYIKEKFFPAPPLGHHQFYTMNTLKKLLNRFKVEDIRGFRLISSRKRFNWEDNYKFYRFNTWWGLKFPFLSPEVNVIGRKQA